MKTEPAIVPWLTFTDCASAVSFYQAAFSAEETYRLEGPGNDLIIRLNVRGAEFWAATRHSDNKEPPIQEYQAIRFILMVNDPENYFSRAIAAGAIVISPITDEHGWHLGRIQDPFGIHWEIGYEMKK